MIRYPAVHRPIIAWIFGMALWGQGGAAFAAGMIKAVHWAPVESIRRAAAGSDNWPLTWADDDTIYGTYGDGRGFEPFISEKLSLGLVKITGGPGEFRGVNLRAPTLEQKGDGMSGRKASGMLCVGGVLYLWARNAGNSQLAWSTDHGATWIWAEWKFTNSFGCPTFVNFGRDYEGNRDGYVYVISPDANEAYTPADRFVMARVSTGRIRERSAYEFYAGTSSEGTPRWDAQASTRASILERAGQCYRPSVTFNAGLKRFLLTHAVPNARSRDARGRVDVRFQGGLAIYESTQPWGPWRVVFDAETWDVGPGDSASLPSKWISSDGRLAYLVFSGADSFAVRRVIFEAEN